MITWNPPWLCQFDRAPASNRSRRARMSEESGRDGSPPTKLLWAAVIVEPCPTIHAPAATSTRASIRLNRVPIRRAMSFPPLLVDVG